VYDDDEFNEEDEDDETMELGRRVRSDETGGGNGSPLDEFSGGE